MFKNDKLFRVEGGKRVYDAEAGGFFEFIYSELYVNFEQYIDLNTRIFYLKCSSKHVFFLNSSELNYLYTLNLRWSEPLNFVFSKNVEIIKKFQRSDLFFLISLKNFEFIYLLPRLDVQNKFYFDLVLGVKKNFNINQFYGWDFKSINIDNIIEIDNFNLSYGVVKEIFNFENCKFKDNSVCKEEFNFLINFEKNGLNKKKFSTKNINKILRRYNYKFNFKEITNHCYWYDDKIIMSENSVFFIDYKLNNSSILFENKNNDVIIVRDECFGGLIDAFTYNQEFLNFNWSILNRNL